jgi:ribose 5-phosphate isomerase A
MLLIIIKNVGIHSSITGIIETSIFTKEVTKIIVAGENGVRVISK